MALVPPELVSEYYQINKPENRMEGNIYEILHNKELADDVKVKMLSQLVPQYQRVMKPKKPFEFPPELLEPLQDIEPAPQEPIMDVFSVNKYLQYAVPKSKKKYITPILQLLMNGNYMFNDQNEFMVNGKPVYRSNVVDLFSYLLRDVKNPNNQPRGYDEFLNAIIRVNIPKQWIGNKYVREQVALSTIESSRRESSSSASFEETPVKTKIVKKNKKSTPLQRTVVNRKRNKNIKWIPST